MPFIEITDDDMLLLDVVLAKAADNVSVELLDALCRRADAAPNVLNDEPSAAYRRATSDAMALSAAKDDLTRLRDRLCPRDVPPSVVDEFDTTKRIDAHPAPGITVTYWPAYPDLVRVYNASGMRVGQFRTAEGVQMAIELLRRRA